MTVISIVLISRTPLPESEREAEGGPNEENDRETGTSAESTVGPAVIDEDLDHKETDNGLCPHNSVAVRLCGT